MEEKVCRVCGRNFVPHAPNQTLCGDPECKRINANRKRNENRAKAKGEEYTTTLVCPHCGKVFEKDAHHLKYCSPECSKEAARLYDIARSKEKYQRAKEKRLLLNPPKPPKVKVELPPIKCLCCGKMFVPKKPGQKYCSKSCTSRHTKTEVFGSHIHELHMKIENMSVEELNRKIELKRKPIKEGMTFTMQHLTRLQGMLGTSYGKLDQMRSNGTLYAYCIEHGITEI